MKIYFISGLAADSRIFRNIRVPDGFEMVHLDWIKPIANESLQQYALRLGQRINRNEPFVLVGMSMGGMIAVEMTNHFPAQAIIIISSIPSSKDLPFYFRIGARLYLHHLIPIAIVKNAAIAKRLFTTETKEDKILLREIIRESDPAFIRWALQAILQWNNEKIPGGLVHIHGTRDEILPVRFTAPTHIIRKAGHLMVMNRASEINEIIAEVLKKLPMDK